MRNKKDFITTPKAITNSFDELLTVVIFERPSNAKLKTVLFPFIKINGKPLLEKQIEAIESSIKTFEVIFCCGPSSNKIHEYAKKYKHINLRIVENQLFNDTNCCESIRLAINNTLNNKILILPEDILLSRSILNETIGNSCVYVHDHNGDNNFEIGAICNDDQLESLTIGIKQNYWTELLFLNDDKTLKDFKNIINDDFFKNKLFFEAVNILNQKNQLVVKKVKQCYKLNNAKTLKRINFE
jgi:CTP:phosphocholine cytidylyltransferase-like protein